jgi:hypothetical protein
VTDPQTAATDHANSFAVGDSVDYRGPLGELRGEIAEIRDLFDEGGRRLRTFFVAIEGVVERIHTSAHALTKVPSDAEPAPEPRAPQRKPAPKVGRVPRSAYTDTGVPPIVDDRTGVEPGSTDDGFDEQGA